MARLRGAFAATKPILAWMLDTSAWSAEMHDELAAHCEQYDINRLTLMRYVRCLRLGDLSGLDGDDLAEIVTWQLPDA